MKMGSRFPRLHILLLSVLLVSLLLPAAGCGTGGKTLTASGTIEATEYDVTAQVPGTLTRPPPH